MFGTKSQVRVGKPEGYAINGVRLGRGAGAYLTFSGSTVNSNASVGTEVGVVSIIGVYVGTPVYALNNDASGKYAINPSTGSVTVASALAAGTDMIVFAVSGVEPDIQPRSEPITVLAAPTNTSLPVITGTAAVGQTLSTTNGTWSGGPTGYSYQWKRGGTNISGATAATYQLVHADAGAVITCAVTATNDVGNATAVSAGTSNIAEVPSNTSAPAISGTAAVGSTLSVSQGTWDGYPSPSFTYQWLRDGTPIGAATASTYDPVHADAGTVLTCTVTATNASGSAGATSAGTSNISEAPSNTVAPSISGTAQVGSALTADPGTWNGYAAPTFTYQWKRDGADIVGATSSTYAPSSGDIGASITVAVTATNTSGSASATSAGVGPVTSSGEQPTAPTISLNSASDTGTSNSDDVTSDTTPDFDYILDPESVVVGAVVKLYRDGSLIASHTLTQTDIDSGHFSIGLSAQPEGTYDYTGTITVDGVESDPSSALSVTIDTTAPVLSNAAASATGDTTATVEVDTNEGTGVVYFVLSTSGTPPSAAQVKAGEDSAGSDADYAGLQGVTAIGTQSFDLTALLAGTYYAYFAQDDGAGNTSSVIASDPFTISYSAREFGFGGLFGSIDISMQSAGQRNYRGVDIST